MPQTQIRQAYAVTTTPHAPDAPSPPIALTNREYQVLNWGAKGKSSWDIAQILGCTEATVNFHFSNIRRKLNVYSRGAAVCEALRLGLITL